MTVQPKPKPRPKRTRADSAASAVKAMVDAAKPDVPVPAWVTLTDSALPFWTGVVRARTRDEWIDVDLVVAAQLDGARIDEPTTGEVKAVDESQRALRNLVRHFVLDRKSKSHLTIEAECAVIKSRI